MRHLHTALQGLKFDSRMTEWNLKTGNLSQDELNQHLNALVDLSDRAIKVELEDEPDDYDGDGSNNLY